MKKTKFLKLLSASLCVVLIAAMALFASGCTAKDKPVPTDVITAVPEGTDEIGVGANSFEFTVTDYDGSETKLTVHTDKTVVGEALQELGLLSGEEGAYGLYVKTVNGVTYDYDTHGKYWAFYINGEYAVTGADMTDAVDGASYIFKVEK